MYDDRDSSCHVTQTYCTANLKDGGFSAGYGRSTDYWLGSTCSGDTKKEVVGAYDCCTKLGDSIGEFFLGRTLTTDFRELVEGDVEGFGYRWENYMRRLSEKTGFKLGPVEGNAFGPSKSSLIRAGDPGMSQVLEFVCDPRLKDDIELVEKHVVAPDIPIHGYRWRWNSMAENLYGISGTSSGLLTTEVESVFPYMVKTSRSGYHHITLIPGDEDSMRVYDALTRLRE
jgi:hypothetical protein